jgi:peptide/nickel transport system substrate-binding protein
VGLVIAWFAFTQPLTQDDETSYRYVEAVIGAPSRINPLFAHLNDADRDIGSLIFSGLTRLGQDGRVVPDLAESWEVGGGGRSVAFHLRPGVRWHTGVAFTSADVIFTYSLLADPKVQSNPDQASLWRQIQCNAPDELTVVCELPEPFAPFLAYTAMGIIPKHFLEGAAAETLFDNPFNGAPVGTGPFRLAQLDQSHAVLKPNDNYHLGPPLLDEIELRFYPDIASAGAAVVRGEAQAILMDSTASPEDLDAVSSARGIEAYTINRSAYTMLYLNNNEPPLNDKTLRQAIAQTVDVDALIADILGGRAVRADSPIVPASWAASAGMDPRTRDLDDARHLLDEAGWMLPDAGDVRTRNGVELRITLMTDHDSVRGALAMAIADELAEIGLGVTVVQEESPDLIRDFLIPRDYQAAVFGFDPGADPDPYPAWHSSQANETGRNLAGYASSHADELMEQARQTTDLDERQRLYYAFQQTFVEDVPSILLYYPTYTYFVTDQVKGIELSPFFDNSSRFRNAQAWVVEGTSDIRQQ